METLRRPSTLVAIAAGLLVTAVLALVTANEGGTAADDLAASPTANATGAPPTAGATTGDGAGATDGASAPAGDGSGQADGDPATGGAAAPGGSGSPAEGAYTYDSSGRFALSGDTAYELPASSTGTVTTTDGGWQLELVAGDGYRDTFTFVAGPENGLDWTAWVLGRVLQGQDSTTPYTCEGDEAFYRPGEAGRTVSHVCNGPQGIRSEGTVEHVGAEELTLGDGSNVTADRLRYAYEVTGSNVSGEGQLDLWLDPATGLRLREDRVIRTVTTTDSGETEYLEEVQFVLSAPPGA